MIPPKKPEPPDIEVFRDAPRASERITWHAPRGSHGAMEAPCLRMCRLDGSSDVWWNSHASRRNADDFRPAPWRNTGLAPALHGGCER